MPSFPLSNEPNDHSPQEACDSGSAATFQQLISSHLSSLQAALLAEHRKKVSLLEAQNQALLAQLTAIQNESGRPGGSTRKIISLDAAYHSVAPVSSTQKEEPPNRPEENAPQEHRSAHHIKHNATQHWEAFALEEVLETGTAHIPDEEEQTPASDKAAGHMHECGVLHSRKLLLLVKQIVLNNNFELGSAFVILMSTISMALRLQYDGIQIGYDLESKEIAMSTSDATSVNIIHKDVQDTWPGVGQVLDVCDLVFIFIFCTELLLRLVALRAASLRSGWIWFDIFIVTISAVDTLGSVSLPMNPSMLRMLRLIRLVRLFRALKAISAFDTLFLLFKSLASSRHSGMWAFQILTAIHMIVGLFLCQILQAYLNDDMEPVESRLQVYDLFGTFSKSMLTMFQISMANWASPCSILVDNVSEWFSLFFVVYRCGILFSVLKVISAVFITETNRVLANDDELTLMRQRREKNAFEAKLTHFIDSVDSFEGSEIRWADLEELLEEERLASLLAPLGLQTKDLEKMFWLLDDGSGIVATERFIQKIGTLRGSARAVDAVSVLKLTHMIHNKIQACFQQQGILKETTRDSVSLEEEDKCFGFG